MNYFFLDEKKSLLQREIKVYNYINSSSLLITYLIMRMCLAEKALWLSLHPLPLGFTLYLLLLYLLPYLST